MATGKNVTVRSSPDGQQVTTGGDGRQMTRRTKVEMTVAEPMGQGDGEDSAD